MGRPKRWVMVRSVAVVAAIGLTVIGLAATPALAVPPTITSFSPTHGPAGTSVTISGTFNPVPTGTSGVQFGTKDAFSYTATTSSITAIVPADATTGKIKVTNADGSDDTTGLTPDTFTVDTLPAPTISSLSPTCANVGATVTITGTNLIGADLVTFAGSGTHTATPTVDSPTQIHATIPSGAATGSVTVHTTAAAGGGGTSNALTLSVSASCATITSFTPTIGGVGTVVTITGTGFTGATGVKFNLTSATFSVNSATQITATVPAGATTGKISVTTPAGTATSTTDFTVIPAPTITSFTPTSGPRGTLVTINGTNFSGTNITLSSVTFNGSTATFSVISSTQLTATVPSNATTGPIKVTTTGGTATSSSKFTVTGLAHSRRVTLKLKGSLTAKGRVRVPDGFSACGSKVPVKVQKKSGGGWTTLKSIKTSSTGSYSTKIPNKSGTYRSLAPKVTKKGETCKKAHSPTRSR